MSRERLPNKAIATVATVLALGGLAACGRSDDQMLTDPWTAPKKAVCNGLPPYEVIDHSESTGFPLLRFEPGVDCTTTLYDEVTGGNVPKSSVNKHSTFFACYEGAKPSRLLAVLVSEGHTGPAGAINLSDASARELAAQQDIPNC